MTPKRKTRMYEPWGYQDQNNYQGAEIIHENDLDSFFAGVEYKRDDNKIHFTNKDGDEVGSLNVNDFIKSDSIVEKTEYKDGILKVYFTNGDIITIDLTKLLDENEFKDGLIVDGHVVKVLVDGESERWLTVSANGVKVSGIQAEIDRLDGRIDDEIVRATSEEARIESKLDQEIADRIVDVNEEETRAIGEETRIDEKLDEEITRSKDADRALDTRIGILNDALTSEKTAREAFDAALSNRLNDEASRATSAETELNTIKANKNEAVARAEYDSTTKRINFYDINDVVISYIDVAPFIKDGMIESVKIEDDKLVITFNAESGKEKIEIPLSDIFNPDNYYTKSDIDAKLATINSNMSSETSDRESGDNALDEKITTLSSIVDAKADTTDVYTKGEIDGKENALQAGIEANADAIALKADANAVYTKEEVDALIAEKEAEITQIKKDYNNLKEIVGEIGGNVEWGVPADGTFNNMMKKSGTVKLGEDTTTSTYTGGITSANKTTLNLNGKNLTFSGTTTTNPAIMTRGKQELTIVGKGTFDAAGCVAVEANGADTVINLSGTTGFFAAEPTYVTDRSGGELIYCYLGTINIYAGVFKNDGADKTFLLNCYDANYSAGTAKIVVYGGKFYDFDPSNAMSESGAPISYLADGYHVETSTDGDSTVYTVKKDS